MQASLVTRAIKTRRFTPAGFYPPKFYISMSGTELSSGGAGGTVPFGASRVMVMRPPCLPRLERDSGRGFSLAGDGQYCSVSRVGRCYHLGTAMVDNRE
jgi:hypothetical protein